MIHKLHIIVNNHNKYINIYKIINCIFYFNNSCRAYSKEVKVQFTELQYLKLIWNGTTIIIQNN